MTARESQLMDHLRANSRAGCDRAEITRQAQWYAQTDPYNLARLPALLAEAVAAAKTRIPTTAN
jgi:hypothetical protein